MNVSDTKLWTKNFISISASNFFLFLTFYFLLVTLPIYVVENLNGEKSQAGLTTTVFLISAIVIRPFAGRWIEKIGSRLILLLSMVIFLTATILYFTAHSIQGLLLIRFYHGIGFGMATTAAGAIAATNIPQSRRGEGMGYFILSSTLAMVVGPYLGLTALQTWGVDAMLQMGVIASIAALLAGLLIKTDKNYHLLNKERKTLSLKETLFEGSALPIALVAAFFAMVYSSILSFVSVHAHEMGLGSISSYFFVVYAVVLLLSRPFTGKWFDRYGANVIVYPAIIIFAIGMFLLGTGHSAVLFLMAAAFAGLGWGTLFPTFQTIAIKAASPKRSAIATATFLSVFDIGIGVGSFLIGLVAAEFSFSEIYQYGSIYVLGGLFLYYSLFARKQNPQEMVAQHKVG
ncbi:MULTISPECIES: MFS transporter [unclassified Bacillus (in: firmicutes)]|uniref:MFS transporter n=1 Tax=unclassified Bacillus (in: firmicutes) TaxID=185979 RepID=UPI0008EE551B|nr:MULTISPECIES: MFS transporter [unclassified Bacillus (in: firmicutes)]SFB02694.1 Predicted arabinose efflux permease, MFS family [Bacillus sp. UNCCL13]SFQ89026.1 Predicted arabinose efflux permease, MFS family [Bacillus sp. cl95]